VTQFREWLCVTWPLVCEWSGVLVCATRRRLEPIFNWIGGFDSRSSEFFVAWRLISTFWAVASQDETGKSPAPFLQSTLLSFDSASAVLMCLYGAFGVLSLCSMAYGTWYRRMGHECERFGWRFGISVGAAILTSFITFLMIGLSQPDAVVSQYALSAAIVLWNAVVLCVKHDDSKDNNRCRL
jgi:hypothetical protein